MQAVKSKIKKIFYRNEIDGLRGIAILSVVLYHIFPSIFPSGFLGVDIFFVISGYLITATIINNNRNNLIEFLFQFYSKRLKRLFPTLFIFFIFTIFGLCLFIPEPKEFIEAGISSLVGLSNIYLWIKETDYFAQTAELNPFTQTWSLGIESQFYFIYRLKKLTSFMFILVMQGYS